MSKKKLLIVDDELDIIEVIKIKLEDLEVEMLDAITVEDAWNIINKQDIQCVLCDIILPDGTGIDLIKKVRQSKNKVPFIFYSGADRDQYMVESLQYGALDFITKPDLSGLQDAIKKGMSLHNKVRDSITREFKVQLKPREEKKVQQPTTDTSYLLGIDSLDGQHAMIISLISELAHMIRNDQSCSKEYIQKIQLYINEHLRYEESLLEKHSYPDKNDHINEHIKLKKRLSPLLGKSELNRDEHLKLLAILNNFRYEHIPNVDKKYADFLKQKKVK